MIYTFEAPTEGEPPPLPVRFEGYRTNLTGEPTAADHFSVVETVEPCREADG